MFPLPDVSILSPYVDAGIWLGVSSVLIAWTASYVIKIIVLFIKKVG